MKTHSQLAQELADARLDVETYNRLRASEERVRELETALAEAEARESREAAEKAQAAKQQMFAGITNVSVSQSTPLGMMGRGNLLTENFKITFTKTQFDSKEGRSFPKPTTVDSFSTVPADVMLYLIEHPDLIPADILALDPDSPRSALSIYVVARKKGYFVNGQRGLK